MADFLDAFKRRESESSEGSYGDEDDDNEPQFARGNFLSLCIPITF